MHSSEQLVNALQEYKFLNPVLAKKAQRKQVTADFEEINVSYYVDLNSEYNQYNMYQDADDDEIEGKASSEEISSSDDEQRTVVVPKRTTSKAQTVQPKFYQLKRGATYQPHSTQPNSLRASKYVYLIKCS